MKPMRIRVLGAAAGGGLPQWNCACDLCETARRGDIRPSTQASVAVSGDGVSWWLLGATPDVARQIEANPELHPKSPRRSPIAGALLVNGEIDQCLGLLVLRESHPLEILATPGVRAGLERNVLLRTLGRFEGHTTWRELVPGRAVHLAGKLTAVAFTVTGKVPIHLADQPPSPDDNLGLRLRGADGQTLVWLPSVAMPEPAVLAAAREADVLFFDGTFWSEHELRELGVTRSAREMGHWPISGEGGSLELLRSLPAPRRLYVHINNSNPIWWPHSPERAEVEAAGVEVARDGQEIQL